MKSLQDKCSELQRKGTQIKLVYGDVGREAFGTITEVVPDTADGLGYLGFLENITGSEFNTPWRHVDTVIALNAASQTAGQNR